MELFELRPGAPNKAPKRKGRGHGTGNGKPQAKVIRARRPDQAAVSELASKADKCLFSEECTKRGFTNAMFKRFIPKLSFQILNALKTEQRFQLSY